MAIYAIGDVQGCYRELRDLLEVVRFDPGSDQLWLVGDLVNRGPASLDVLRFVRSLGSAAKVVLGNHDLYLLKVAFGNAGKRKRNDTLQELIDATDAPRLLDWLRRRPLMHVDGEFAMVHAGLLPCWTVAQARVLAAEVEAVLGGDRFKDLLTNMWGNTPAEWSDALEGWERLRAIVNAMTRMRFVTLAGKMEFDAKGAPVPVERAKVLPFVQAIELDRLLPDGGLPRGAVVEVASQHGLGRATTFALLACAAAQADARLKSGNPRTTGAWCAFVDPWSTLHAPAVVEQGVDLSRLLVVRPPLDAIARVHAAASIAPRSARASRPRRCRSSRRSRPSPPTRSSTRAIAWPTATPPRSAPRARRSRSTAWSSPTRSWVRKRPSSGRWAAPGMPPRPCR